MSKLARLQRALGHEFSDPQLLTRALTHRSAGSHNNERLEFLGDSILNHTVAEALYHRFPTASEGDMSRMRAALVSGDCLAEVARELNLGDCLVLGQGERKSGGHRRGSILADAFEALIGAILLDSGIDECRACVLQLFAQRLEQIKAGAAKDAKTELQEYLQGRGNPLPVYELLELLGDDHNQQFNVACRLRNPALVVLGSGSSRRRAEQAAARSALERLAAHGS